MRIERIDIKGFRCIDELSLELVDPDGAAVPFAAIIGPNGAGKTTLLEAVALSLRPRDHRIEGGPLACRLLLAGGLNAKASSYRIDFSHEERNVFVPIRNLDELGVWTDLVDRSLFVAANRDAVISGGAIPAGRSGSIAYHVALDTTATSDRSVALHAWLIRRQLKGGTPALWDAIRPFLRGLTFQGLTDENEFLFGSASQTVKFQQLSAGQRKLIFLFAEVLMHCGDDGLLLIDEPEAHLHPDWQRRLPAALMKLLPNGQIIAATHSPYIIDGLHPWQVFELVPEGV